LPQNADGCGLIVDEHPALATSGNFAAENHRPVFGIDSIRLESRVHCFGGASFNFEHG